MLTLILGGCGTGKSTRLMEQIRQEAEAGKEVLVLVPEQFSFEEEKKLYSFLGPMLFNRIHTFSFTTLSRHILQLYGSAARTERYAGEQEKLLYLYQAVCRTRENGSLQILGRQADSSEFIHSLLGLLTKIRKAGVTAQQLLDTAQLLPEQLAEKTMDIGHILYEYDRILTGHDAYDGLTDLTEAAAIANIQDFFAGKQIYLDEFDSFTGDQYLMLDVMIGYAEHVTAAIRTDELDVRLSPIFEGGNQTRRQLRRIASKDHHVEIEETFCESYCRSQHEDLKAVSTQILRSTVKASAYSGHVQLAEALDPAGEAEWISASICRMLSEDHTLHCQDIAIAVKSMEQYGMLLTRSLERYALPYFKSEAKPILHMDLVQHLLALLSLLEAEDFETDTVLQYLKTPFSGYDPVTVSMLEQYCFTWGVEQDSWLEPFWEEGSESEERSKEFGGRKLEELRICFVKEISALRKGCQNRDVRTVCTQLYHHLSGKYQQFSKTIQTWSTLRQQEFVTLWNLLMEMLDTVVQCLGDEQLSFHALHKLFVMLCQNCNFSTPPQTLDAIQIVEAQSARLDSPRIVFVPGVIENDFPGEIHLGGVFSQRELELLDEKGISLSRMFFELYSDERLIVNKILSAPTEQLCLSYPLCNAAGECVKPSLAIAQICRMFPDAPLLTKAHGLPLRWYAWTYASAYYHFVRNLHLDTQETASLYELLKQDPFYAAKVKRLVQETAEPEHTVSPLLMQQFLGEKLTLSPSAIETFYQCPYQYFSQYCLHLYVPQKRELSSLNLGNFAHYCLEQLLRHYPAEEFAVLGEEQLRHEIRELSARFSAQAFSDTVRRDSRFQLNYHMAGRGLLQLLLHMQKEMRNSEFVPVGFEVSISEQEGALSPLTLRNGAISCMGKIDRIDRCDTPSGSIYRVVDYKTGTKLFSPEKLASGLDMQMLIYLFALQEQEAYNGASPGGVLYMPSGQLKLKHYGERSSNAHSADEILDNFYCMRGLLQEKAASHMEPEVAGSCIPVLSGREKDVLFSVNELQMEQLHNHVLERIEHMADQLYAGNIAPNPYLNYPCRYCSCSDLCRRTIQPVETLSKEERQAALAQVFGIEKEDEE